MVPSTSLTYTWLTLAEQWLGTRPLVFKGLIAWPWWAMSTDGSVSRCL